MSTKHKLTVERASVEWHFNAENSGGEVWFHFFVGPVSAGLHMSLAQARELAEAIDAAADDLEAQKKLEDGGEPTFDALAQRLVTHGDWERPT